MYPNLRLSELGRLEKALQDASKANRPISTIEALQIAHHDQRTLITAGGSVRRVGTEVVDFKHLDSEEIDALQFAEEMQALRIGEGLTFTGSSSDVTLIKMAIELKSSFTGKHIELSYSRSRRHDSQKDFTVRQLRC
jgi:hypothetical protein